MTALRDPATDGGCLAGILDNLPLFWNETGSLHKGNSPGKKMTGKIENSEGIGDINFNFMKGW